MIMVDIFERHGGPELAKHMARAWPNTAQTWPKAPETRCYQPQSGVETRTQIWPNPLLTRCNPATSSVEIVQIGRKHPENRSSSLQIWSNCHRNWLSTPQIWSTRPPVYPGLVETRLGCAKPPNTSRQVWQQPSVRRANPGNRPERGGSE